MLLDQFGRAGRDLRVSLTDRCNLRCSYCMPEQGLPWLPRQELLTDDEVVRVVAVMVGLGVDDVRFTGGEPLLRPGLVDIVAAVAGMTPRPRISLTTNGIGLTALAEPLAAAGLDRVNVSLDTLDRQRFIQLTHRDRLDDVLAGLTAARSAGLTPVKLNAVLVRGSNDAEAVDLVRFALRHDYELRFIEQMPLDAQHGWDRTAMLTGDEILGLLRTQLSVQPDPGRLRGSAPAETFLAADPGAGLGPGRIGMIASVTQPFCAACDRVRLTADGQVRNCLFAREESPLRDLLRSGASDAALADVIRAAMWAKRAGHGIGEAGFAQPERPMSAIGG